MMAVRLRNRMDELGYTNQILADKSGIPLATVNRIVAGQTENPNIQTLTALVSALDITLDEITGLMIRSDTPVQPSPAVGAYENMLQVVQTMHRAEIQSLKDQHRAELDHLEEKHRSAIQALNLRHQQHLDTLDKKHLDSMARMERHHEAVAASKDRWISRQFWLRIAMTVALIALAIWALILESRLPDFGIFQWQAGI